MTAVADACCVAPAPRLGTRKAVLIVAAVAAAGLAAVVLFALVSGDAGVATSFRARLAAPSFAHPFGTDALGRDMLARTLKGLALSFRVGLFAATASTIIALLLALVAAGGPRWADAVVAYLVDMTMGLPHLVLLILISFSLGGGANAVISPWRSPTGRVSPAFSAPRSCNCGRRSSSRCRATSASRPSTSPAVTSRRIWCRSSWWGWC
jgi:peptide/nickel transport system permease protein